MSRDLLVWGPHGATWSVSKDREGAVELTYSDDVTSLTTELPCEVESIETDEDGEVLTVEYKDGSKENVAYEFDERDNSFGLVRRPVYDN